MTDENGLPSQADLDAVNAELMSEANTAPAAVTRKEPPAAPASPAKAAHDAMLSGMTAAQKPDLTPGPDAEAAIAYVMSKGYEREAAQRIVQDNGVDTILTSKSHEESTLKNMEQFPKTGVATPVVEQVVSRHGEIFNPDVHAQLPTGDPKTDSTGRFIMKEHDYSGPKTNPQFPD